MCVRVYNTDTKENTDNPREFAEMLGISVKQLPVDNNYGQLIPDSCLCQVDIKKACDISGYNYIENADYEAEISKKTPAEIVKNITSHR